MNEFNFNELKNFEVPESWVENALNIPSKNKKAASPILFYRFAAGITACVVLGVAVTLSLVFGIGDNVKLTAPNPNDQSPENQIVVSTDPDGTGHTDPSGRSSVFTGRDEQSTTAVTEPSENGTNGYSKTKQQGTAPANKKSKTQSPDGTKPNSGNSKQNPISSDTQPGTGENATQAPDVQDPTDDLPEPCIDPTNEPWVEPTWQPPCENNYSFTATVESSLAQGDIYCRVTDKNGTTFGIGGLFDKTRLVYKYDVGGGNTVLIFDAYERPGYYGRIEFGESYNVIFYNAIGETIRQGRVTVYYDEYYAV